MSEMDMKKEIDTETISIAPSPKELIEKQAERITQLEMLIIEIFGYRGPLYRQRQVNTEIDATVRELEREHGHRR